MINRSMRLEQGISVGTAPARYVLPQSRTSRVEQFLIFITIVILPLQNQIPAVAGMSVSFLIFVALGAYVIVNRPRSLSQIWYHPVFITAYAFIGVSALLEFTSPFSNYDAIVRFGQMIGGAVCVAVLCRDRSALAVGLYGYIGAALWVSIYLYLSSYGMLQGMGESSSNFHQATQIRSQAFGDQAMQANINGLAFTCTQGAVVAFALALWGSSKHRRILFLGIATFCLVASFLPMSRSTAVISLVTFAALLYTHGFRQGKVLILACILGMGIYMLVPDVVWTRMVYSTEVREGGKMEARARLYTTALNRLPEYIVSGVGAGNFYQKWGVEKGFSLHEGSVTGAHNTLLQITIFWGVLGLSIFLLIIWFVYRSIPLRCGRDELSLALLGVIISFGPWLLTTHGFYEKLFAFGIGILIGAQQWIWPTGIVSAVKVVDAQKEAV